MGKKIKVKRGNRLDIHKIGEKKSIKTRANSLKG